MVPSPKLYYMVTDGSLNETLIECVVAVLTAYWSGAVLVCIGMALETIALVMPWIQCNRLADADCYKKHAAKLQVGHMCRECTILILCAVAPREGRHKPLL